MRGTLGEFLNDRLLSSGIDTVFGIPGDYSLKYYNNLFNTNGLRVIGTTTEMAAGYAADAYARVRGLGVVCVTYCVGGFSVSNAIACAHAEKSPVVVISGAPGVKERDGRVLLHHMVGPFESQQKMFEPITCANTVLRDPERAGYEIDRVLTAAQEFKQPVYIELPRDMIDKPIRYDAYTIGTPKEATTDRQNLDEAIAEVVQWINTAKHPVIWAGVECARFGLAKRLIKFAEQNNLPIATSILGKSVVNERHPLALGVYCESTSTNELRNFMDDCDCLIMLGVMMTDMNTGFLPLKYQRRNIVRATTKELQIRNHSFEDVKFADFCDALFRAKIERRSQPVIPARVDKTFVARPGVKMTVTRLFEKINTMLDSNMAIIADVGDSLFGALDLTVHDSHHFISDAFYTSMGFAMPGALGVLAAQPTIRPIVIVGDGAFQMTGMEFSTLARYSQQIGKQSPIAFVLNNGGYGTERIMLDGPFNDIADWAYEKVPLVTGCGVGYKVHTEEELERAVDEAIRSNQPALINVVLGKHDHTDALRRMFTKVAKRC